MSLVVHPLDLESFGWTTGGIVLVDGAKLNEPRQLSQKISVFMHVDPLPNPVNNTSGGEANDAGPSNQTYLYL
jgi:hypothetical protein